jgi:hypothetical protein
MHVDLQYVHVLQIIPLSFVRVACFRSRHQWRLLSSLLTTEKMTTIVN